MKRGIAVLAVSLLMFPVSSSAAADASPPLSPETQECLGCHLMATPGIVADWGASRHSKTVPAEAVKESPKARRVSASSFPDHLSQVAVGCFECHTMETDRHADGFEHNGYIIHLIVTPGDCSACHLTEVQEYATTKKAMAHRNLLENPLYMTLVDSILGQKSWTDEGLSSWSAGPNTLHETCLGCHGTKIEVRGVKTIETDLLGEMEILDVGGWPNQGVGRVNPDGTFGSCSACHPRHSFSIEIARKPYTCAQCHLEPDVPAWNVYKESKHGNIYSSKKEKWNFDNVPWVLGVDFSAPTCATCHNSLVVDPEGEILVERTHDFGSRLWIRLFSLIYSHPQPRDGDVTAIRNADGLPLPTTFLGVPATEYLIGKEIAQMRKDEMSSVCTGCHGTGWVEGHFGKMDRTIKEVDRMIFTTTRMIFSAWEKGLADPENPFDEALEKRWLSQWLFYANSIKYSSAMTGAPDYATFKNGWWELSRNLAGMEEIMDLMGGIQGSDTESR